MKNLQGNAIPQAFIASGHNDSLSLRNNPAAAKRGNQRLKPNQQDEKIDLDDDEDRISKALVQLGPLVEADETGFASGDGSKAWSTLVVFSWPGFVSNGRPCPLDPSTGGLPSGSFSDGSRRKRCRSHDR